MIQKVRNQRKEVLLFFFIILIAVIIVLCVTIKANAYQNNNKSIQVKSIMIESGDTLWDIASEHYSDDYDSIEDYIIAIKECNHIASDKICAGGYLVVPYYQ